MPYINHDYISLTFKWYHKFLWFYARQAKSNCFYVVCIKILIA
jgi:hypothetical protein